MYLNLFQENSEKHLGFQDKHYCNVLKLGFHIDTLGLFEFFFCFYFQLFTNTSLFSVEYRILSEITHVKPSNNIFQK